MKLTVLGKFGPYAAAGGATSSYLVRGKTDAIVLDFGSGALSRLQQHTDIAAVRAIVLSHLHNDHICDLLPLSYLLQARNATLNVIAPAYDCPQQTFLQTLGGLRFTPLQDELQVGEFSLSFARMVHPLDSYAIKVRQADKTLCYSGDTSFCPQLPDFAAGSDLLLLDCGKPENTAAPHLSLQEAAFLADSLHVHAVAS